MAQPTHAAASVEHRRPGSATAHRPTALRLVGAVKAYPMRGQMVEAFHGVTLDVFESEILCLLGPNGCGKSAMLRVLGGLEGLTAGQIVLFDRSLTGPDPHIGMVFQDPLLLPWLTIAENVGFGLRFAANRQIQDGRDRVRVLLDQLGLRRAAQAYPWQVSGGIAQRAAIARALLRRPRVLLMDEPFAALDPVTRMEMQDWFLQIAREQGMTVVFVTHDAGEAIYLGDRVALMTAHPGRIHREWEVTLAHLGTRADILTSGLYREILSEFLGLLKA
jgi:ABC-type nitrate/sulfonate/bicarbonate transport system ATPase subunit